MKVCVKCQRLRSFEDFYKDRGAKDGLFDKCKQCNKEYSVKYYQENIKGNALLIRAIHLKALYNITLSDYNRMFEEQGGKCAICDKHQSEFIKAFSVDHDHKCCSGKKSCGRCIRGLLCRDCNSNLYVLENVKWTKSAYNYLNAEKRYI